MDSRLTLEAVEAMVADRRRKAGSTARAPRAAIGEGSPAGRPTPSDETVTVRFASPDDARALERLAALDSGTAPTGPSLVAEVDGEVVAALPLGRGRALADPLRRTVELVGLLELREAQLRGTARGRHRRARVLGRGRAARAQTSS